MKSTKQSFFLFAGLAIVLACCADATAGGFVITPLGGFVRGPYGSFAFSPLGIAGRRNPVCMPQMAPMGYSAYNAAPIGYAAPQAAGYQVVPMAASNAYVQNVPMMYSYGSQDAAYAQAQSSLGLVRDIWQLVSDIRGDIGIGDGRRLERRVDDLEERIEKLENQRDDGDDNRRNGKTTEAFDADARSARSNAAADELIDEILYRSLEIEKQRIQLQKEIDDFRLMSEMINHRLDQLDLDE